MPEDESPPQGSQHSSAFADDNLLLHSLRQAAEGVNSMLSQLTALHPGRPTRSQDRRRVAAEADEKTTELASACDAIGLRLAGQGPNQVPEKTPAAIPTPSSDPEDGSGISQVADAQNSLDRARNELQTAVETARADGSTWREIGETLGITAQTAHKRFDPRARQRHADYMRERSQRLRRPNY